MPDEFLLTDYMKNEALALAVIAQGAMNSIVLRGLSSVFSPRYITDHCAV